MSVTCVGEIARYIVLEEISLLLLKYKFLYCKFDLRVLEWPLVAMWSWQIFRGVPAASYFKQGGNTSGSEGVLDLPWLLNLWEWTTRVVRILLQAHYSPVITSGEGIWRTSEYENSGLRKYTLVGIKDDDTKVPLYNYTSRFSVFYGFLPPITNQIRCNLS